MDQHGETSSEEIQNTNVCSTLRFGTFPPSRDLSDDCPTASLAKPRRTTSTAIFWYAVGQQAMPAQSIINVLHTALGLYIVLHAALTAAGWVQLQIMFSTSVSALKTEAP